MEQEKSTKTVTTDKKVEAPKKSKIRMIIVIAFLIVFALATFISLRGSYLETLEIGENYLEVFWKNVRYKYVTMAVVSLLLFLVLYLTNRSIKKGLKNFFEQEKKEMPKLPNKSISLILGAIISVLVAGPLSKQLMLMFNNAWFGSTDPIFDMDIGYYIFQKPFIETVLWGLLALVIGLTIYTVIYYIIVFNYCFDGIDRQTLRKSKFIKQITRNIKIVVIIIACITLVKTQDILTQKFLKLEDGYELYGAGITDVSIKLWGYRILSVVMVASVFVAIHFFYQEKTKKVILSILVVPTYLIGMAVIMLIFQVGYVNGNELDRQKHYISKNIEFTQNAYGVNVEEITLEHSGTITSNEVAEYQNVIHNIAIVDENALLKELQSAQTSKGYYTFRDASIANYSINGKNSLVYLTPREIISNEDNRTYNNKTYEYTHGFGAIVSSATSVSETGAADYIQTGFQDNNQAITITEPRIYFGLETNNTVVTNSKNKAEFDYPILTSNTAENAENTYQGEAGLTLNFVDRLILAIKEGDLNLALSSNVTNDSKILTNRNIIERAKKVMPYLIYDENPYLVVNNEGKLIWVLDAYTTTNYYPYSQKSDIEVDGVKQEINYIRNSVKVLIDAYNGTIEFYITDRTDPIVMAYNNIFKGLFTEKEIPQDISKHFIYPEFLFNIQVEILNRYHKVQPDVLYRADDVWNIGTHKAGNSSTITKTEMQAYYTMVRNEDGKDEIGLMNVYTPYEKQNLIAYVVGTHEGSQTGTLKVYKFLSDNNILGPMQLDTQIEQDETIAEQLEAINVTGTRISKNMLVIPIANTVLYVEPIYQVYLNEKEQSNIPLLKKVIVASGNKVAIGDTLRESLNNLLSQYAVDIEVENTEDIDGLIDAIIKANTNLKNSSSNNDWEMIGKDLSKLQDLINKLEETVEERTAEENMSTTTESTSTNTVEQEENSIDFP